MPLIFKTFAIMRDEQFIGQMARKIFSM